MRIITNTLMVILISTIVLIIAEEETEEPKSRCEFVDGAHKIICCKEKGEPACTNELAEKRITLEGSAQAEKKR